MDEFDQAADFRVIGGLTAENISLKLPVVLAGYGIQDSAAAYNDFEGMDMKGKAVLIFAGFPGYRDTLSAAYKKMTESLDLRKLLFSKMGAVKKSGASALMICNTYQNWESSVGIDYFGFSLNGSKENPENDYELASDTLCRDVPYIIISPRMAHTLLQGTGIDINRYEAERAGTCKPAPMLLKNKEIAINIQKKKELIFPKNILGCIPGKNADEYVIVGAHYDHIGKKNETIYYGADDNASGVTAVLTIARAIKEMNIKPEKTTLFALWASEEEGLLGSEYFLKKWNNGNIDSYFNFDMVGRYNPADSANYLTVFHSKSLTGLQETIEQINRSDSLDLHILFNNTEDEGGSDHESFSDNKIPYCWFFTGFHPDYHEQGDVYYKCDTEAMTRIVNLGLRAVWERANRND